MIYTGGHIKCLKLLLAHGTDVECTDIKGQTPLFVAVHTGQFEATKILLEHGANPNGSLQNRSSPLMSAVMQGRVDIVQVCNYCKEVVLLSPSVFSDAGCSWVNDFMVDSMQHEVA